MFVNIRLRFSYKVFIKNSIDAHEEPFKKTKIVLLSRG